MIFVENGNRRPIFVPVDPFAKESSVDDTARQIGREGGETGQEGARLTRRYVRERGEYHYGF